MPLIGFADESGTAGNARCYAIGVVSVDAGARRDFEAHFRGLHASHGVQGEAKWTRVRTSHGLTNFALAALDSIMRSRSSSVDIIVVNKRLFRNWNSPTIGTEGAFYQTYTYLLKHIAKRAKETTDIMIDDRSDEYPRRTEMIETIGNAMLAKLHDSGRLDSVVKVPSKDHIGIQIADILTGAVCSAHERCLNPSVQLNAGKRVTIARLASMLGWEDLCFDTMPSDRFNIWHFPIEYRAHPETRPVLFSRVVPFVQSHDLV